MPAIFPEPQLCWRDDHQGTLTVNLECWPQRSLVIGERADATVSDWPLKQRKSFYGNPHTLAQRSTLLTTERPVEPGSRTHNPLVRRPRCSSDIACMMALNASFLWAPLNLPSWTPPPVSGRCGSTSVPFLRHHLVVMATPPPPRLLLWWPVLTCGWRIMDQFPIRTGAETCFRLVYVSPPPRAPPTCARTRREGRRKTVSEGGRAIKGSLVLVFHFKKIIGHVKKNKNPHNETSRSH